MTPWHQGQVAFRQGKLITDNPFAPTNDRNSMWEKGWLEARLVEREERILCKQKTETN